jgi:hypothetical protein
MPVVAEPPLPDTTVIVFGAFRPVKVTVYDPLPRFCITAAYGFPDTGFVISVNASMHPGVVGVFASVQPTLGATMLVVAVTSSRALPMRYTAFVIVTMSFFGEGGFTVTVAKDVAVPLPVTERLIFSVVAAATVGAVRVPTEHAKLLQVISGLQVNLVAPEAAAALASRVMLAPD